MPKKKKTIFRIPINGGSPVVGTDGPASLQVSKSANKSPSGNNNDGEQSPEDNEDDFFSSFDRRAAANRRSAAESIKRTGGGGGTREGSYQDPLVEIL